MSGPGAADQRAFDEYLGGVGIWRSDRPEGPFTWVGFGPQPGGYGSWNDGGTSGGSVRMLGSGVWEMWFSGAKMRYPNATCPPYFLGHFSPVLRRFFAVLLRFPASWRRDGENGRKMA